MRKLTEEEETEPSESMSESDESIYHIEEIKNIVDQQKLHSKNKNQRNTIIIDTGSPATIMPLVKRGKIDEGLNCFQN